MFVSSCYIVFLQTRGQGTCGGTSWAAAKEISRRANKMDEEGMEVAVCRHGFLLKALNMYRGKMKGLGEYTILQLNSSISDPST